MAGSPPGGSYHGEIGIGTVDALVLLDSGAFARNFTSQPSPAPTNPLQPAVPERPPQPLGEFEGDDDDGDDDCSSCSCSSSECSSNSSSSSTSSFRRSSDSSDDDDGFPSGSIVLDDAKLSQMLSSLRTKTPLTRRRSSMHAGIGTDQMIADAVADLSIGSRCESMPSFETVAGSTCRRQGGDDDMDDVSDPSDLLVAILAEARYSTIAVPFQAASDFFEPVTDERVKSYTTDVVRAVRNDDIPALRRMRVVERRTLNCCNKFGESIMHMACRRGSKDVVAFLLNEADGTARVRDDYGRTPLHDACWMATPDMDLIDLLIESCPDLLVVGDKRGVTPLGYVRREHWTIWRTYLTKRKEVLLPRFLLRPYSREDGISEGGTDMLSTTKDN